MPGLVAPPQLLEGIGEARGGGDHQIARPPGGGQGQGEEEAAQQGGSGKGHETFRGSAISR